MKIGVIIPTVKGREEMLAVVLDAYESSIPDGYEFEIVTVEDASTVGEGWNSGALALESDIDFIHFGVDDAVPHLGWAQCGVGVCRRGSLPAARLETPSGELEAAGSMGEGKVLVGDVPDGTPCRQTGVPMMPVHTWIAVGEFLPIHYYVEDDWYIRAAHLGFRVETCSGYAFTHHGLMHPDVLAMAGRHRAEYLDHVEAVCASS